MGQEWITRTGMRWKSLATLQKGKAWIWSRHAASGNILLFLRFFYLKKNRLKITGKREEANKRTGLKVRPPTSMNEKMSACLLQFPFSCLSFYIKHINNPYLTACLQSNIHLCSSPELLQRCRKAWWKATKGRGERGGGGGNGTEEHGSSRCETLLTIVPPTRAICKTPVLPTFAAGMTLGPSLVAQTAPAWD